MCNFQLTHNYNEKGNKYKTFTYRFYFRYQQASFVWDDASENNMFNGKINLIVTVCLTFLIINH